MSDYVPEVGHRVRATVEGVVEFVGHEFVWLKDLPQRAVYVPRASQIERLPDPEPEWQPGDVVRMSGGTTLMRTRTGWFWSGSGCPMKLTDTDVNRLVAVDRDVTPLVRDGQVVQP